MTTMMLSVILPVYNVEAYLASCLESLRAQTYSDFEIIAIDDGSTDGSATMLADYVKKDSRLRIIRQSNAGLGAARNRGLDAALGKYIYFMDSDDMLSPDTFERTIGQMEKHDLDLLVFSAKSFCDKGASEATRCRVTTYDKYYAISPSIEHEIVDGGEMMARQLETGHLFVSVPLRIMKTSMLRDSGCRFIEGVVREDESFTSPLMLKAKRVMAAGERFYLRRVREGSLASGGVAARHIEGLLFAAITLMRTGMTLSRNDRIKHVADFILRNYRRAIDELSAKSSEAREEAFRLMAQHAENPGDVKSAKMWFEGREKTGFGDLRWRILRKIRRLIMEVIRR